MIAVSLGARRADEAVRVVRALGSHRYVAGRLHLVHAMAFACVGDDADAALAEGRAWAKETLARSGVDPASRDERLWRRSSDAEVAAVLGAFWAPDPRAALARSALRTLLERHDLAPPEHPPFDETAEDSIHPLLVDAGWELLPLAELDPERHRGAISAFGEPIAFESARFEEETAMPARSHLYELPAIGPVELLRGADESGELASPLVVWAEGDETYVDYVIRGVRRAAKLPEVDED
jgi:hypothetical protein